MIKQLVNKVCLVLVIMGLVLTGVPVTEVQAATNDPYGFIWRDEVTGLNHVQYYEYSARAGAYMISDRVTIKGNELYDMAGLLIMNDVASFSESKPTVIMTEKGLFVISKSGEVRFMENSLDNTYSVAVGFPAQYFTKDHDDLGENVVGTETKPISSLVFSGTYSRHSDSTVTSGSYVLRYAVGGNAEKIGYKAFFKNTLKSTAICYNSSVYEENFKKTLSKTCKGAKFVGYTGEYNIYLYDLNGTVFEYRFKEKYQEAHKVFSDEVVYYIDHTEAGFISAVVTDKEEHTVSTVIKEPKVVNSNKITKVKNFQNKSMAYNGNDLVGTLTAKKNALYWKSKKLPKSIGAIQFGISAKGTPCWTLNGKKLCYWNGSKTKVVKNVSQVKFDGKGRFAKYKQKGKWKKFSA